MEKQFYLGMTIQLMKEGRTVCFQIEDDPKFFEPGTTEWPLNCTKAEAIRQIQNVKLYQLQNAFPDLEIEAVNRTVRQYRRMEKV